MTSDDFKALGLTKKTEAVLIGIFLPDRSNEHGYIKLYNNYGWASGKTIKDGYGLRTCWYNSK